MAYNPTQWIDHLTEHPNRWTMVPNADGTVTLTPAFGEVVQAGTPISAANMNKIEQGIADATEAVDTHEARTDNPHGVTSEQINIIPAGTYSFSDPGTDWPMGVSVMYYVGSTGGWPVDNGQVTTERTAENRITQRINEIKSSGSSRTWTRTYRDSSWSELDEQITSAGGQTINGDVSILGALYLREGTDNGVIRSRTGSREIVEIRAKSASISGGAGINLYGDGDSTNPGEFRVYAGGSNRLRIYPDGRITTGQTSNDLWDTGSLRWNSSGYLEYNDGGTWRPVAGVKSVQRGYSALGDSSGAGNDANVSISSIDRNKAFVSMSMTTGTEGAVSARLTSNTNLRLSYRGDYAQEYFSVAWEVVEYY